MSLLHRRTRWLSLTPNVILGDGWLRAETNRAWVALSLFSYRREVHVDARSRRITLRERRFWRTHQTRLDFSGVDYIEYGYGSLPTSFFAGVNSRRLGLESADTVERFQVALVLRDATRLPLFSFVGDGERMTGALGVLMGDSVIDLAGEQEEQSLRFVQQLQKLTSLPLGPGLPGSQRRPGAIKVG